MTKKLVEKSRIDTIHEILPTRYRLKCKNHIQKVFANIITDKGIIIAAGPAGCGKSYVAVARAIELLQNKTSPYDTIIISTPAEEAGENLGFLPGTIREKMEPYLASTLAIFDKIIGKRKRLELEGAEIIIIQPLGFIRGSSIDNTILLMEEAQNATPSQMKMLLTRIGENSKFIISGDLDQSDRFKRIEQSGLYDALNRHKNIDEIGFVEFQTKDIVRNPLISKILDNYKSNNTSRNESSHIIPTPIIASDKLIYGSNKSTWVSFKTWFVKNFKW
jgi:phosphate starvation-inducible PhoH-like protein